MSIYRISRNSKISAEGAGNNHNVKEYFDRLLKLIPSDVVAAYLAVRGFWMPNESSLNTEDPLAISILNWWLPFCGLLATFLLRILGTSEQFAKFKDIQWKTVFISVAAFLLWVLSIQNPVFNLFIDPRIPPSLLVLFTLLVPLIQKGSKG